MRLGGGEDGAKSVGMTLDVAPRINDMGALEVPPRPSRAAATTGRPTGLALGVGQETELLVWLADEVQEATMERDQVNVSYGRCVRYELAVASRLTVDPAQI